MGRRTLALGVVVLSTTAQVAVAKPPLKVRKDSVIEANEPLGAVVPDVRGELAKSRDAELRRHYERLAQLDVLLLVAEQSQDPGFAERVEAVRRKEMQRYHKWMIQLRHAVLAAKGAKP